MKVKFKVEKNYNGKAYYPNIEYVFDDEAAKDILSKTKYAEVIEDANMPIEEESPVMTGNEEQKVDEIEPKRTKNSKKAAKKEENAQ